MFKDESLFKSSELLLICNLKEIQSLKNSLDDCENGKKDLFFELVLGVIEVLDTYEIVEESVYELKKPLNERETFIMNRFKSVKKRLLKFLNKNGVHQLDLDDMELKIGYCKVIDTMPDNSKHDDTIIEIVKSGYVHGDEVIREAEVIIVKN